MLLTFLFSLVINGLAASGSLSADTIAEVSDKYPTYVTPDRLTFAVWGVIYILELVLVVAQFGTSERTEKALSKLGCLTSLSVRWRLIIAFLLNALWLPLYTNLQFGKALLVIILYLILLLSIYIDVNTVSLQSFWEWVVYGSGIACNLSWVIVATLANKLNLAASYGIGVDQRLGLIQRVVKLVADFFLNMAQPYTERLLAQTLLNTHCLQMSARLSHCMCRRVLHSECRQWHPFRNASSGLCDCQTAVILRHVP